MTGIIGLSALLIVLGLSLVITRVATISLMYTGRSELPPCPQDYSIASGGVRVVVDMNQ